MDEEGLTDTRHDKIHIGKPMEIDHESLVNKIRTFESRLLAMDDESIKVTMQEFVPTYQREE
jgi:hypothetical protein